jgi:hypothetical protein
MTRDPTLTGDLTEDGTCRIEDDENPDAWIEAEHRDGWVGRVLFNEDGGEAYQEMIHPYRQQCAHCRRWLTCERWHADSPYCPRCKAWYDYSLPKIIAWMFDGDDPREEVAQI